MNRAAVLLDKDGTLVENVPYNADPERTTLMPGAPAALGRLHAAGYELVVVSNQSGVGMGLIPEPALAAIEQRVRELLENAGVPLRGFLYCPHHPDARLTRYRRVCRCRKPSPGLLLRAFELYGLDPARSWMVGDILDDVEAGRRAGCRTVLVDTGAETEWLPGPFRAPDYTVTTLPDASRVILA